MNMAAYIRFIAFCCIAQCIANSMATDSVSDKLALRVRSHPSNGPGIMFWRPQKVGSSTFLSLLVSYSFRYNLHPKPLEPPNSLCVRIARCCVDRDLCGSRKNATEIKTIERAAVKWSSTRRRKFNHSRSLNESFHVSFGHELCGLDRVVSSDNLKCAFRSRHSPREVIMLRHPLSRALSVYYFWGELWKMRQSGARKIATGENMKSMTKRLGAGGSSGQPVTGHLFLYHGDEGTPPPEDVAVRYARMLPYRVGMPGPSYSWSAFAASPDEAAQAVLLGRVAPVITERMDESLVALTKHLGWTLADMVVVVPRKALSTHPKHTAWPQGAVKLLNDTLIQRGEIEFYNAASRALDMRLEKLRKEGVDVDGNLRLLKDMRKTVTEYCLSERALDIYRRHLSKSLSQHPKGNKLRDVPDEYVSGGHCFNIEPSVRELIYSFDVCGGCEAHAIQHAIYTGQAKTVAETTRLEHVRGESLVDNDNFRNCPLVLQS